MGRSRRIVHLVASKGFRSLVCGCATIWSGNSTTDPHEVTCSNCIKIAKIEKPLFSRFRQQSSSFRVVHMGRDRYSLTVTLKPASEDTIKVAADMFLERIPELLEKGAEE
jgi:hypothetical protein